MKIVIIGSGAIGKTYGLLFHDAAHEVHFLLRSEFEELSNKNRFKFFLPSASKEPVKKKLEHPNVYKDVAQLPSDADLIVISLKTTENDALGDMFKSFTISEQCLILTIQNGIGNEEFIQSLLPKNPIIAGVTTMGAKKNVEKVAEVEVVSIGQLKIAPYGHSTIETCEKLKDGINLKEEKDHIVIFDHYKEIRWNKLLWNIPFNSLSTLCNLPTNKLASEEPYKTFVKDLMHEIQEIAKSESVDLSEDEINEKLRITAEDVDYYPSMHSDWQQKKPLEVEYIVTHPLEIARKNEIDAPLLAFLNEQLIKKPIPLLDEIEIENAMKRESLFFVMQG